MNKDNGAAASLGKGFKNIFSKVSYFVLRKEALSVVLILLFVSGALFSMYINPQFYSMGVYEGDVALKDIFAPYDFVYTWGIDEDRTEEKREHIVRKVPYVLVRQRHVEERTYAGLRSFFDFMASRVDIDTPQAEKIRSIVEFADSVITEREARTLFEYQDKDMLKAAAVKAAEETYNKGLVSDSDYKLLTGKDQPSIVVVDEETRTEKQSTINDILSPGAAVDFVDARVDNILPVERRIKQPLGSVIRYYLSPNIKADQERTELRKEKVSSEVKPVLNEWEVRKNEIVVAKGQRVTGRNMAQLMQITGLFRQGATIKSFAGSTFFFFLIWILVVIYLSFSQERYSLKDVKSVAIVLLSMTIILVISEFVMRSPQPSYFIPLAFMGMMITLLKGVNVAFLSLIVMGLLISVLAGGKVETMFVLLIGGAVGMYSVRNCRRRSDILRAGFYVGMAKLSAIVCVGLMNNMEADFFIRDGLWGLASGFLSAFLVMGLLPVFEYVFKVPTNITLLELSDLNHPLLKRLSLEAPGTYHHSILVGNLAESACDAVGANSLLARVGSYYHDIGKIPKAEYFSENEMGTSSRHENLSPSMSALIIAKHVKEGVEMAKKHKLHPNIIDLIEQHHGNSLIAYFYKKALEKSSDKTSLKEENFRYPGPRPQTREGAIILLADSVEASCRAMEEHTAVGIRALVKKIINNKFIDGQLDECDLTLKGIEKIALSFERVLMGIYHSRLNYPASPSEKVATNGRRPNGDKRKKSKPQKENRSG